MFKKMKHMKNEKGLTLIELLAVIVILAIVAAIAIPAIGNIINNSRDKAVLSDLQGAISSAEIANADGACTVSGTTSTCAHTVVDFKSNKIDSYTVTITGGVAAIEATLTEKLKGTKMVTAIGTAGTNPVTTAGEITDVAKPVVKISKAHLNNILD